MAVMTTVLTPTFANDANTRKYTVDNVHTVQEPALVLHKQKVPVGNQVMNENSITCVQAAHDADGALLSQNAQIVITVRAPKNTRSADMDALQARAADVLASDEMKNVLATNEPLAG